MINFEVVTTADENEIMMKRKISIKNKNSYMFETFDVKNSIKRISAKLIVDDTIIFLNIFKNLSSDFEKFLE